MTTAQSLAALTPGVVPVRSAGDLCRAMRRAESGGPQLDLAPLDRVLAWDASRALVEVQAGTPWQALAARLTQVGPALLEWAGQAGCVGESMAANRPGPDGRPLVALIESVALVTPDGELCRVSRNRDADLFALAIGGQGMFGLAYSVTLRADALAHAAAAARAAERLDLRGHRDSAAGMLDARAFAVLVPPDGLETFLGEARELADAWRVPLECVAVTPTLSETETALRWAKQPYAALNLRLALPQRLGAQVRGTQLRCALIDRAIRLGGSFPIETTPEASRAQLEHCYPELAGILDEKRRRDPADRLTNAWYRQHLRLMREVPPSVRWNAQAASA